ncbi:histone-fold-containing protein [Cubamyces lactineus]|nr:histone-fold-containing protein [Cubamyces lactineus]
MSRQTTPLPADSIQQSMDVEATQEETQVAEPSVAAEAKPKKAKASEGLVREPGKSVLPYSRVQKILKADRDLVMVQREAAFLISRATEEFIGRFAEAAQKLAERERRTTVQAKDIVATVRRADEFAFLEELFPWADLGRSKPADGEEDKRRKPGKSRGNANESQGEKKDGTTTLDRFMSKTTADTQETEEFGGDSQPADMDFVMNEDGTMSMVPAEPPAS